MKIPAGAGKGIGIAVAIGVGALAVWWLASRGAKAAGQAVEAVANVNEGTPYAGGGVVGTIGNATNQVSGGVLGSVGSWIGTSLYDWFGNDDDITSVETNSTSPFGGN